MVLFRTQSGGARVQPPALVPRAVISTLDEARTVLVVNILDFVGAGRHTTGDALLANRRRRQSPRAATVALDELTTASAN